LIPVLCCGEDEFDNPKAFKMFEQNKLNKKAFNALQKLIRHLRIALENEKKIFFLIESTTQRLNCKIFSNHIKAFYSS